jgi:hypothetical protein
MAAAFSTSSSAVNGDGARARGLHAGHVRAGLSTRRAEEGVDLNGTRDEVLPPATVDANRKVMEPYAKKYRVGRIEGQHHYLFTQDSIKTVVTTWMRYIESGYFD